MRNELKNPDKIFLVCYLSKYYKLNRISRSDGLSRETLFLNYVKTDDIGRLSSRDNIGS